MYVVHISACMCAFYFSQYPKRNNHTLQSHSVFCTVYCCVHCIAEIVLVRRTKTKFDLFYSRLFFFFGFITFCYYTLCFHFYATIFVVLGLVFQHPHHLWAQFKKFWLIERVLFNAISRESPVLVCERSTFHNVGRKSTRFFNLMRIIFIAIISRRKIKKSNWIRQRNQLMYLIRVLYIGKKT